MRAVLLVFLLVLTGCAHRTSDADDQSMPDDFAGTVAYENGSVPPPYHYRWAVTFDATTATLEWRPGYKDVPPWRERVDITDDQRAELYTRLADLGVFDRPDITDDGMVGGPGGDIHLRAGGETYDLDQLGGSKDSGRLLKDVAKAVKELVPESAWDDMKAKQDDWSDKQPK